MNDTKHQPKVFRPGDWVYLKLGDGDNILSNKHLPTKLRQRYVGRFQVIKRVGQLAYQLDLPDTWLKRGVHPVIGRRWQVINPCRSPGHLAILSNQPVFFLFHLHYIVSDTVEALSLVQFESSNATFSSHFLHHFTLPSLRSFPITSASQLLRCLSRRHPRSRLILMS